MVADAGTDVFLSLVDSDLAPFRGDLRQLAIRALCTNRHLPIQMAVGGAPISQMYAEEIGADGYAGDASSAVDLFVRLVGKGAAR